MTISEAGIARIKQHESCSLTVYDDQAGLPTIGWGHLIRPGEFASDARLTQAEADALFAKDLAPVAAGVAALLAVEVTQAQFDACCSLVFNIGLGAFGTSSVLKAINSKAPAAEIVEKLKRWNKITVRGVKTESRGLTARRAEEAKAWGPA